MMANTKEQSAENIVSELRRGVISIAVLSQLEEEQYGYSLLKRLTAEGLEIDQGTLYPLLRRLESQGLLQSSWRVESDRPRRYYVMNEQGRQVLRQLTKEWENLVIVLDGMLK
jgi:PadR family transcriptional regulator PadR